MQYHVQTRKGTVTFETSLTPVQAVEALKAKAKPSEFESSLLSRPLDKLSEKQTLWLLKLAHDFQNPRQEQAAGEFLGILSALNSMTGDSRKRAVLRLENVTVKAVTRGRNEGCAYIFDSRGEYAGKITLKGGIYGNDYFTAEMRESLVEANADPVAAAKAYGKLTGRCSVCGRTLTDPNSVEQGIGPVCLSHMGG